MARFDVLKRHKHASAAVPDLPAGDAPPVKPQRRRENPDYKQFSAYVPIPLYRRLKGYLAMNEIELSEAVEEALTDWIAKQGA
jgi:hypothetical protein